MNKSDWELDHDWFVYTFKHWVCVKNDLAEMLRRHPNDKIGDLFRGMIKTCDKEIKNTKKWYKSIYGVNFNMRMLDEGRY